MATTAPGPDVGIVHQGGKRHDECLGLDAFNRAHEPKRLELYPRGHFSAYTDQFERASDAATEWFTEHLRPGS